MRLLPAVLLPTGEETEAVNKMCLSFTRIVPCILDDFLTVLYNLSNYNLFLQSNTGAVKNVCVDVVVASNKGTNIEPRQLETVSRPSVGLHSEIYLRSR